MFPATLKVNKESGNFFVIHHHLNIRLLKVAKWGVKKLSEILKHPRKDLP